jgi:vacuolar-type H+-ATPase subunit F/Vma7
MIHLAKHIELLLLDNDCVIIPRLGGLVAHYTPAQYVDEEQIIYPPYRTIGFNSQLKINDGVLTESYMNLYGINFNEAYKRMNSEIDELLSILHESGKYSFDNIGELHYNIYGVFEFKPYDNKLTSPELYGLNTLQLKELSEEAVLPATVQTVATPTEDETITPEATTTKPMKLSVEPVEYDDDEENNHKAYIIRLNRTFVRSAVAVAAIIIFMFTFSTPIENNKKITDNQAQLVPNELIQHLKENSLINKILVNDDLIPELKSSVNNHTTNKPAPTINPKQNKKQIERTKAAEESHATTTSDKRYQLIVASSISKKQAARMVQELKEDGYDEAKVLISNKMVRVRIAESDDDDQAQALLNKLSKKSEYKNAWIMKTRNSSNK